MSSQIINIKPQYTNYLIDEAKFKGDAESISFPINKNEILYILQELNHKNIPLTIQGGKTSIVGSSIPLSGHVLNLSKMNHVLAYDTDNLTITVEPGITLVDLQLAIDEKFPRKNLFWAPQPTETSATVGGVASTNAQGITAHYFGEAKEHIQSIKLITYDGKEHIISHDLTVNINNNTYNLLDIILGSEGICGIITELTLKLLPKAETIWGLTFFFNDKNTLYSFINNIQNNNYNESNATIIAQEYIDRHSIDLVESRKNTMEKIKSLPNVENHFSDIVYIEIQGNEEDIELVANSLMEMAELCGCDIDAIWALCGETEVNKMRAFRHAISETINFSIEQACINHKNITKLGTDIAFFNSNFADISNMYINLAEKYDLSFCLFGHLKNNHLHFNILPQNHDEYNKGLMLLQELIDNTTQNDVNLYCEHGIGKLKAKLLRNKLSTEKINIYHYLKETYDPNHMINQNNILQEDII